jgi:hypothetical protein
MQLVIPSMILVILNYQPADCHNVGCFFPVVETYSDNTNLLSSISNASKLNGSECFQPWICLNKVQMAFVEVLLGNGL